MLDELKRASQAMAEHLYSSAKPGPGGGEGPPPGAGGPHAGGDGPTGKPEDVIDVEFEEKK